MGLFDSATFQQLENGLKGAALRQKTIANNIANVDTPNYKAKRANFKHTLTNALQEQTIQANRTNPRHFEFSGQSSKPFFSTHSQTMYHHNGNNVDIDKEMSQSAKNQIYYNALTDRISSKFNSLKTAVRGR
ncbi:flagellar basal-body rod protein FlgB [Alteribacillus persepolensis]|uniref:Flagellar basal body rod protein FlgB n=1 Tax=Alteribacillus persepolensis TaxID=568899 RepID=A0A1G7YME2_9BACI|nr:flagellar basal body rod protein FlgB [Alteribacillus persepolensis]SDG97722.1 flagellar basal-body rod protein FlgB [Alteribacillus persepolensis]